MSILQKFFSKLFSKQRIEPPPVPPPRPPAQSAVAMAQRKYDEASRILDSVSDDGDADLKRKGMLLLIDTVKLDPSHTDAQLDLARIFHFFKNRDTAIDLAEEAYKLAPDREDVREMVFVTHYSKVVDCVNADQDLSDVYTSCKRAFEINPYSERGQEMFTVLPHTVTDERVGEFGDFLEDWLENQPDDNLVRMELGRSLLRLAELPSSNPTWPSLRQGLLHKAEGTLREYLRRLPGKADGHYVLGKVHIAQDRLDDAMTQLEALVELDIEKFVTLMNLIRMRDEQAENRLSARRAELFDQAKLHAAKEDEKTGER